MYIWHPLPYNYVYMPGVVSELNVSPAIYTYTLNDSGDESDFDSIATSSYPALLDSLNGTGNELLSVITPVALLVEKLQDIDHLLLINNGTVTLLDATQLNDVLATSTTAPFIENIIISDKETYNIVVGLYETLNDPKNLANLNDVPVFMCGLNDGLLEIWHFFPDSTTTLSPAALNDALTVYDNVVLISVPSLNESLSALEIEKILTVTVPLQTLIDALGLTDINQVPSFLAGIVGDNIQIIDSPKTIPVPVLTDNLTLTDFSGIGAQITAIFKDALTVLDSIVTSGQTAVLNDSAFLTDKYGTTLVIFNQEALQLSDTGKIVGITTTLATDNLTINEVENVLPVVALQDSVNLNERLLSVSVTAILTLTDLLAETDTLKAANTVAYLLNDPLSLGDNSNATGIVVALPDSAYLTDLRSVVLSALLSDGVNIYDKVTLTNLPVQILVDNLGLIEKESASYYALNDPIALGENMYAVGIAATLNDGLTLQEVLSQPGTQLEIIVRTSMGDLNE